MGTAAMAHTEDAATGRNFAVEPRCEPGATGDCCSPASPHSLMPWPAILGIAATGLAFCFLAWTLLGA